MKLVSLDLRNFRQHVDSKIAFSDGLTGIIGPNGSGKTTILEAIAWALYGAPAVRGNNDTIRSNSSDGGAKASVELAFDLGGQMYKVSRTLDSGGKSGSAVLEVDGRALRSGITEVSAAVTRLLGMDYQQFFTSFFTMQKQLEFMSQLEGRQRANAISRMLGYERLSKAREQANEERKSLTNKIAGIESALADPKEIAERKRSAKTALDGASSSLREAEKAHAAHSEARARLLPLKEASDQKAKRHAEISRRLEIDQAALANTQEKLSRLHAERAGLESKCKELESLRPDLKRYEAAREDFSKLKELQKHEKLRQQLSGQAATIEQDIRRLESRQAELTGCDENHARLTKAIAEAEASFAEAEREIRSLRERRIAEEHSLQAQISQLEQTRGEVEARRAKIAEAGAEGKCPTCERPLADELATVLTNFDAQVKQVSDQIALLRKSVAELDSDNSKITAAQSRGTELAAGLDSLRKEKAGWDGLVLEEKSVVSDIRNRSAQLDEARAEIAKLPVGFDQDSYDALWKIGEELKPVHNGPIEMKTALERGPAVESEIGELTALAGSKSAEISSAEQSTSELGFASDEHEKLTSEFNSVSASLSTAGIELERQRGVVNTASAILEQIEREERDYQAKKEDLEATRQDRLYAKVLSDAFDSLRTQLNDRIRPEMEATASELLAMMTDGRYNVLEIDENYHAAIRDDGEIKQVISGGEEDIVNLALRLAISQMIAYRAGQSFSLLILDEVFGSLDESRRENVVALLQNLKNRFEQIILITHIESIYDAVDNCLWVEFEEKTKTSRITDRSEELDRSALGV